MEPLEKDTLVWLLLLAATHYVERMLTWFDCNLKSLLTECYKNLLKAYKDFTVGSRLFALTVTENWIIMIRRIEIIVFYLKVILKVIEFSRTFPLLSSAEKTATIRYYSQLILCLFDEPRIIHISGSAHGTSTAAGTLRVNSKINLDPGAFRVS